MRRQTLAGSVVTLIHVKSRRMLMGNNVPPFATSKMKSAQQLVSHQTLPFGRVWCQTTQQHSYNFICFTNEVLKFQIYSTYIVIVACQLKLLLSLNILPTPCILASLVTLSPFLFLPSLPWCRSSQFPLRRRRGTHPVTDPQGRKCKYSSWNW